MKHLFALVAVLFCAPALASDWARVSTSDDGSIASVDIESWRRVSPKKVRAWVYFQFPNAIPVNNYNPSITYASYKNLQVFDCEEERYLVLSQTLYAQREGGEIVQSAQVEDNGRTPYTYVTPDTMGETVLKMVCSYEPPRRKK